MTSLLKLVPPWAWVVLAGIVGAGQQVRVVGLRAELETERGARLADAGKLAACRTTRTSLLELTIEQNGALANLRTAEHDRAQRAEQAQQQARTQAGQDYHAANQLLRQRTGGDACVAAEVVINQELGL